MLSEIGELGRYVFAALGGGAAALALFVKFGANKIADATLARYQSKLEEKLETHRAKVETKKNVTQCRFDKEFEVLYKLVQDYYEFTYLTWNVYLALGTLREEHIREKYEVFQTACDEYTKFFYRNCVVLNENLADAFENGIQRINRFRSVAQRCVDQLLTYGECEETDIKELVTIHDELNEGEVCGIKKMTNLVRHHLASLEII